MPGLQKTLSANGPKAGGTFPDGAAAYSSRELGAQLAAMLRHGAATRDFSFAAAPNYDRLTDDNIEGDSLRNLGGAIRAPRNPGLGVKLNREKPIP